MRHSIRKLLVVVYLSALGIFLLCGQADGNGVKRPYQIKLCEDFYSTRLELSIYEGGPHDSMTLVIADSIYRIPANSYTFRFRPPSDRFALTVAIKSDSAKFVINITAESIRIRKQYGDRFVLASEEIQRIPKEYKNRLYWVALRPINEIPCRIVPEKLMRALVDVGARPVLLPVGDYGFFQIKRDSATYFRNDRGGWRPALFYVYGGGFEKFKWTVENVTRELFEMKRGKGCLPIIYRNPPEDERIPASARWDWREVDTLPVRATPREYNAIFNILQNDDRKARISLVTTGEYICDSVRIDVAVRQTDLGVEIRPKVVAWTNTTSEGLTRRPYRIKGAHNFEMPSDTFNLFFIEFGDTSAFAVKIGRKHVQIEPSQGRWVSMFPEEFSLIPRGIFWVYSIPHGNKVDLEEINESIDDLLQAFSVTPADRVVLDSGLYEFMAPGIATGYVSIMNDSTNLMRWKPMPGSATEYTLPVAFFRSDKSIDEISGIMTRICATPKFRAQYVIYRVGYSGN